jgi:putative endonuclease
LPTATKQNNAAGPAGERAALRHLEQKGYRIRERNWRCRIGEMDIICERDNLLIFVEVKSSLKRGAIPPEWRVHERKQQKLRSLGELYLKHHSLDRSVRFDVVSVSWSDGHEEILHIENAF